MTPLRANNESAEAGIAVAHKTDVTRDAQVHTKPVEMPIMAHALPTATVHAEGQLQRGVQPWTVMRQGLTSESKPSMAWGSRKVAGHFFIHSPNCNFSLCSIRRQLLVLLEFHRGDSLIFGRPSRNPILDSVSSVNKYLPHPVQP